MPINSPQRAQRTFPCKVDQILRCRDPPVRVLRAAMAFAQCWKVSWLTIGSCTQVGRRRRRGSDLCKRDSTRYPAPVGRSSAGRSASAILDPRRFSRPRTVGRRMRSVRITPAQLPLPPAGVSTASFRDRQSSRRVSFPQSSGRARSNRRADRRSGRRSVPVRIPRSWTAYSAAVYPKPRRQVRAWRQCEVHAQFPELLQQGSAIGHPAGQTVEPLHDNNVDTPTPG